MNISNLVYNKNNSKLEDLISMKEFKTEEDLKNKLNFKNGEFVNNEGKKINIFLTEQEFLKKYSSSGLNMDNIYYNTNQSKLLDEMIIYLDLDNFIVVNLTNSILMKSDSNLQNVVSMVENLEQKFQDKDYEYLLMFVPDTFKMQVLGLMIDKLDVNDYLYTAFMSNYTLVDYGFNHLKRSSINKIIANKSDKLKEETMKKLSHLPDKIVIYRGEADKSTSYDKAYSWTISPSIATFFALRFIEEKGRIISGIIDKKDVIEYFNDREQEVLVCPENVKNIKVYDFYSMDYVAENTDDIVDRFSNYKYILKNHLNFKHDSKYHGKLHSLRVLLNALSIGKLKGLSNVRLNVLALASIYHDIGRTNDEEDDSHGKLGVEIFEKESGLDSDIVKFIVENHCVDDSIALAKLKEMDMDENDKCVAKELLFILKDADALDRLRFGHYDLDFTYLRNKESIGLILFAYNSIKFLRL